VAELEAEVERLRHPPSVGGRFTERSLSDLAHAAQIAIGDEQAKASPDNWLIALLCDLVRLTREAVPVIGEHIRAKRAEDESLSKALADSEER